MNVGIADVTLPLWLVVSQWTLLFALGFLIIVMYRQVAFLQRLNDQGSEREGLPSGEKAPAFDYTPINLGRVAPVHFEPTGRWTLLVFADPGCASCQNTLLALERLAPKLEQKMRILVLTSAELGEINAADAFRTASTAISRVHSDVPSRVYRITVTPFGYIIDPAGMIRARDIVADESSIQKLARKVDRSSVNVEFTVS